MKQSDKPRSLIVRLLRGMAALLGLAVFAFSVWQLLILPVGLEGDGERSASRARPTEGGAEEQKRGEEAFEDDTMVIVLDPGHGGRDGGAVAGGHIEKNLNLDIAQRIRRRVEERGHRVVMTRSGDHYIGLEKRTEVANRYKNVLFVSVHQNTAPSEEAKGVETYFAGPKPASVLRAQKKRYGLPLDAVYEDERSRLFAQKMQAAFCRATEAVDRGIRNRNLVVTRWVHGPSILVECAFISNPAEALRMKRETHREKVAEGIADGIFDYIEESKGSHLHGLVFKKRPPETASASLVRASP